MKKIYCENCSKEVDKEDDLNEAILKGTRLSYFICPECLEDIESWLLIQ